MHVCHGSWRYDEIVVTLSPVGKQYNELMHNMRMMNWWRRQWNGMRNFFVAKWHEKNASVATSVPLLNVFRTRISSNCFEHGWEWRMTWRYLVPGNCMHTINRKCHISGLNGLCELCRMPRTLIDWNCVSRRKKNCRMSPWKCCMQKLMNFPKQSFPLLLFCLHNCQLGASHEIILVVLWVRWKRTLARNRIEVVTQGPRVGKWIAKQLYDCGRINTNSSTVNKYCFNTDCHQSIHCVQLMSFC